MHIYLAGPMRGYAKFNAPAFDAAAAHLRALGHQVFSPAELDREQHGADIHDSASGDLQDIAHTGFNLRDTLNDDLTWIAQNADAVALLPGWEKSKGAGAEVALAVAIGIPHAPFADFDAVGIRNEPGRAEPFPTVPESICAEADRLVSGNRQSDYGHPLDNFTQTGRMWGAILGLPDVRPELVGLCMAAVKISRETNAPKRDNLVDLAGYAKTVDLVVGERLARGL